MILNWLSGDAKRPDVHVVVDGCSGEVGGSIAEPRAKPCGWHGSELVSELAVAAVGFVVALGLTAPVDDDEHRPSVVEQPIASERLLVRVGLRFSMAVTIGVAPRGSITAARERMTRWLDPRR